MSLRPKPINLINYKHAISICCSQSISFSSRPRHISNITSLRPVDFGIQPFRATHSISTITKKDFSKYFQILQISEESDQSTVRDSFLKLAKKFHPDGGHPLADALKFQEIENAYRNILQKFHEDRHNKDCEGEYGLYYSSKKLQEDEDEGKFYEIKHSTAQHRQYLSYQGLGIGTPSQREKQFSKYKAMKATENVVDYKVKQLSQNSEETSLVTKNKKAAKNIRTRYGIDRIVEDKIQEAMAKGDFDNLPSAGKPLKHQSDSPYVDTVTFKLNQILINSGYAPEWVMLEKEIRDDRRRLREAIEKGRGTLGPAPLSFKLQRVWDNRLINITQNVKELNRKIDKYNFLVPLMSKQTMHFSLEKELQKIFDENGVDSIASHQESYSPLDRQIVSPSADVEEKIGLRTIISIFKGK